MCYEASLLPSQSLSPCEWVGDLGDKAAHVSITDSAGVFINWLNDVVAERAYSRKLEMEADAVGMDVSRTIHFHTWPSLTTAHGHGRI